VARYERSYAGERRTYGLHLKCTPSERDELKTAADQAGARTVSEFGRELIFRRLGTPGIVSGTRRDPEATAIIRALDAAAYETNAVGNNLNQIARHANITGELADMRSELREALALNKKAAELYIAALEHVLTLSALGRAAGAP